MFFSKRSTYKDDSIAINSSEQSPYLALRDPSYILILLVTRKKYSQQNF